MDIHELVTEIRNLDFEAKSKRIYAYLTNLAIHIYPGIYYETYPEYTLYYSYTCNYVKLYTPTKGIISRYQQYEDYGYREFDFRSSIPEQLSVYIERFVSDLYKVYYLSGLSHYYYPYINSRNNVHLDWLASVMDCYRSLKTPEPDYRKFVTLRNKLLTDLRNSFPFVEIKESTKEIIIGNLVISTSLIIHNEEYHYFTCELGKDMHVGMISPRTGRETMVEFYSNLFSYLNKHYPQDIMKLNIHLPISLDTPKQMLTLLDLILSTSNKVNQK